MYNQIGFFGQNKMNIFINYHQVFLLIYSILLLPLHTERHLLLRELNIF